MSEGTFHIKIVYAKGGLMRFVSHRDVIRIWKQAVIRAGIPVAHSSGFNPRPKISFYNPLPVGVGSVSEILSMSLVEYCDGERMPRTLEREFPEGMYCISAGNIRSKREISVVSSQYKMPVSPDEEQCVEAGLARFAEQDFRIHSKKSSRTIFAAETVGNCFVEKGMFYFTLKNSPAGSVSVKDFLPVFFSQEESLKKLYSLTRYGINGGGSV